MGLGPPGSRILAPPWARDPHLYGSTLGSGHPEPPWARDPHLYYESSLVTQWGGWDGWALSGLHVQVLHRIDETAAVSKANAKVLRRF